MDVVEELSPTQIVFLGDLVHAPRPAPQERHAVEVTIANLAARAHVVVVLGNHDRGFTRDFASLPVEACRLWSAPDGAVAVHGDREIPEGKHTIIGHLHPALGVTDHAGASHRMPVFVTGPRLTLLPAFSPLAAGVDIRDGLTVKPKNARVIAASGKRVVDLGPLEKLIRV